MPRPFRARDAAVSLAQAGLAASVVYSKSRRLGLRAGSFDKKPNTNKATKILTTIYTTILRVNIFDISQGYEELNVLSVTKR